ncbi:hypothetical protein ACAG26_03105 [Mycobacterium sp. pUA109]|uniref:hypothetical protein n=1 Tax=Mycobacterium sp. pUA109 TaxID=3238982 RepID=UPI00351B9FE7
MTAAVQVGGHGDDLAARHLAADNRIEAAAPGWAGRSAAALSARAARWAAASTAMVGRVGAHATDLHTGALRFSVLEATNARLLAPRDG